jgi:hypothetical protein
MITSHSFARQWINRSIRRASIVAMATEAAERWNGDGAGMNTFSPRRAKAGFCDGHH